MSARRQTSKPVMPSPCYYAPTANAATTVPLPTLSVPTTPPGVSQHAGRWWWHRQRESEGVGVASELGQYRQAVFPGHQGLRSPKDFSRRALPSTCRLWVVVVRHSYIWAMSPSAAGSTAHHHHDCRSPPTPPPSPADYMSVLAD